METFLLLLTAHLLADFVLQSDWMIRYKDRFGVLLLHVTVVVLVSFLLLGNLHGPILIALFATHFALDFTKTAVSNDGGVAFLMDQAGHLAVVAILAILFPEAAAAGWWPVLFADGESLAWYYVAMCLISGVILIAPAGGFMIGKLTEPISRQLQPLPGEGIGADTNGYVEGLRSGGKYIGWLERLLTMLLFLINQPGGIGFVIAAKSILRFGEIKHSSHRKIAEYIIIGTFMSFGWALLVSVSLKAGVDYWNPLPKQEPEAIRVKLELPDDTQGYLSPDTGDSHEKASMRRDDSIETTGDGESVDSGFGTKESP